VQSYYENDWRNLVNPIEAAEEALEIIKQGKAVAFIGSGVSMGFYPSWEEIIKKLCEKCGIKFKEGSSSEEFIKIAEDCKQKNEKMYYNTLIQLLGKEPPVVRRTYILLLSLPFKGYITINLDPMLATGARDLKGIHQPFVYPSLPYNKLNNGQVFYIHGFLGSSGCKSKKLFFLSLNSKRLMIIPIVFSLVF